MSAPTRTISHSLAPQGCGFLSFTTSPSATGVIGTAMLASRLHCSRRRARQRRPARPLLRYKGVYARTWRDEPGDAPGTAFEEGPPMRTPAILSVLGEDRVGIVAARLARARRVAAPTSRTSARPSSAASSR